MTPRSVVLAVALTVPACDFRRASEESHGDGRDAVSAAPPPGAVAAAEAPEVRTDVDGLRRHIKLPKGVTGCRWTERTIGDGILGPSDHFVQAFVELSPAGWDEVACDAAARTAAPRSLSFDPARARAMLPLAIVSSISSTPQGELAVPAVPLPEGCIESASVLHIRSADRIGTGLWIEAYTM